jgi:hypothetical protein
MWKHMNDKQDKMFKKLLFCVAEIISKPYLAREYKEQIPYKQTVEESDYFMQGPTGNPIPKVIVYMEDLRHRNPTINQSVGIRVWVKVNDPNFSFAHGFKNLIEINSKRNAGAQKLGNAGPKRNRNADEWFDIYEDLSHLNELYYGLFQSYKSNSPDSVPISGNSNVMDEDTTDPDALRREHLEKFDPIFHLNPYTSMEAWIPNVCAEQSNINTYFNATDDVNSSTFRDFPFPENVGMVNFRLMNPRSLFGSVLPNWVRKTLMKKNEDEAFYDNRNKNAAEQREKLLIRLSQAKSEGRKKEAENSLKALAKNEEIYRKRLKKIQAERMSCFMNAMKKDMTATQIAPMEVMMWLEKEFAQHNDFIKLRIHNLGYFPEVINSHPDRNTKEHHAKFVEAMEEARKIAFEQWKDTWETSTKIPYIASKGLEFMQHLESNDNVWHEYNICFNDPKLSVFGNWIAKHLTSLDKCSRVDTNFQLSLIALIAATQSFAYEYELRTNLLFTGPKATGKSFMLDLVEIFMFFGSVMAVSHSTSKANNTCF